jgi:hypothetical protein
MSKQIFSKIAKIGEEIRSAEVIKVELNTDALKSRLPIMEKTVADASRTIMVAMAEGNQFQDQLRKYNDAINEADVTFRYLNGSDIYLKQIQTIRTDIAKAEKNLGVQIPEPFNLNKAEQTIKEAIAAAAKLKDILSRFKPIKI